MGKQLQGIVVSSLAAAKKIILRSTPSQTWIPWSISSSFSRPFPGQKNNKLQHSASPQNHTLRALQKKDRWVEIQVPARILNLGKSVTWIQGVKSNPLGGIRVVTSMMKSDPDGIGFLRSNPLWRPGIGILDDFSTPSILRDPERAGRILWDDIVC